MNYGGADLNRFSYSKIILTTLVTVVFGLKLLPEKVI